MHSAKLKTSKRLQRTLAVLKQGKATTRQIIRKAHVCAVNSIITELRANGMKINCRCLGRGIFEYELKKRKPQIAQTCPRLRSGITQKKRTGGFLSL